MVTTERNEVTMMVNEILDNTENVNALEGTIIEKLEDCFFADDFRILIRALRIAYRVVCQWAGSLIEEYHTVAKLTYSRMYL